MAEPGPPHKAAEAPGLRKPPGPSRLRHEIHPESTDDESNRPRGVLEVPNSDPDDDDDEPPGSPGTEEMLKKLSAPRSKRSLDTQPIVVGLLTRGNAPSADLNEPIGFSYGRPTAGLAKPLPVPGKAPANNSGHQSGKKGKENTGFTKALATTDNTSPNNNGVHQPGNGGLPNRRPEARTQSQSQPAKHRGKAGDNVSIQKQQHRSSFKPSAVSPEGAASRELHEQPLDSLKPLHLPPRGPRKQSFKLHSERQSRKIGGQDAQARQDHGQRVNVEPSRSSSSQELLASQAARETSISSRPSADQSFAAAEGDTVPTPENDTACQGDLSLDRAAGPTIQGSSINEFGLEPMDLSENNAMGSSQTRHSRPCSTQQLQQLHRVASEPQAASEHSRPVSQQQLQPTLQQQQPTLQQQQPTLQQQQPTLQQQQIAPEPLIPPTAVSTQREHPSKSPRTRSSAPSGCSRPTGVRKPQHRTRPQVHTAPIDQAQSPGQVGRFSKLFEGHLQNVRAVFYAEVMQNEHIQDAEIRVRETKIEGLKESVDEAKRDAAAIRERNFDLSVELRYQLKVVADMQKYVSQLKNDHMRNCVEPRARRIAELQREKSNLEKEKAELESEFTRVIQSLQNGRRATSQAFEECLAQYKTSEEKRLALIEVLKRQERLLESEGQKREEMERQLAASLTSIKIQLEANPEKFIEGLNDIRRRFDARDTKDRQDNSVRKCLEVLNDLKELSARHAGKPIKIETETISQCIDPKLSALSAAIGNIKIPTQDLQDLMSNQLAIIKTDILKHQALSAELQKVNSDKDVLSQQLNHQTAKCKELEEKLERFQQTESDLKARATRLETDLAELKRQINDAKPSRRELEQQLIGLRDQLAQANRRADDAASNVEEAKRLRKDNQREAVEQKKAFQELQDKLATLARNQEVELQKVRDACESQVATISANHEKTLEEQRAKYHSKVENWSKERKQDDGVLTQLRNDLKRAIESRNESEKNLATAQGEVQAIRKSKDETAKQLEAALEQNSFANLKIIDLSKELQKEEEARRTEARQHEKVRSQYADLKDENTKLVGDKLQLESQVSSLRTTVRATKADCEARLETREKEHQAAFQLANESTAALQSENANLQAAVEAARAKEKTRTRELEGRHSAELESLRRQLGQIQESLQRKDDQIAELNATSAENLKRLESKYEADTASLRQQLEKSSRDVEEWKMKCTRTESAKERELAVHKETTERKMREKFEEERRAYREQKDRKLAEKTAEPQAQLVEDNRGQEQHRGQLHAFSQVVPETQDSLIGCPETQVLPETQFTGLPLDDSQEMLYSGRPALSQPTGLTFGGKDIGNRQRPCTPAPRTHMQTLEPRAPKGYTYSPNCPKSRANTGSRISSTVATPTLATRPLPSTQPIIDRPPSAYGLPTGPKVTLKFVRNKDKTHAPPVGLPAAETAMPPPSSTKRKTMTEATPAATPKRPRSSQIDPVPPTGPRSHSSAIRHSGADDHFQSARGNGPRGRRGQNTDYSRRPRTNRYDLRFSQELN